MWVGCWTSRDSTSRPEGWKFHPPQRYQHPPLHIADVPLFTLVTQPRAPQQRGSAEPLGHSPGMRQLSRAQVPIGLRVPVSLEPRGCSHHSEHCRATSSPSRSVPGCPGLSQLPLAKEDGWGLPRSTPWNVFHGDLVIVDGTGDKFSLVFLLRCSRAGKENRAQLTGRVTEEIHESACQNVPGRVEQHGSAQGRSRGENAYLYAR